MLIVGVLPTIAAVAWILAAAGDHSTMLPLVVYAAAGGTFFIVQAGLLARRRRLEVLPA